MLRNVARLAQSTSSTPLAPLSQMGCTASTSSGVTGFSSSSRKPQMTEDTLNPQIKEMAYAVRGEIVIKAGEHEAALARGEKRPFKQVISCNIGNPQELGQKPLSFHRSVLALMDYPGLMDEHGPAPGPYFPPDAVDRAKALGDTIKGGSGAYSHSKGIPMIRQWVADFIAKRDNVSVNPEHIFLTDGASPGVQLVLQLLIRDKKDGIMVCIPQYPLYSASIAMFGGSQVGYYLDEAHGWGLTRKELERSYKEAKDGGVTPRALCVINPGNPTGAILSKEHMIDVLSFAAEKNLVLMADEVYQENVYHPDKKPWFSFRKVLAEHPDEAVRDTVQLFSFHSTSKGFIGECGRRGGYFEAVNVDEDVLAQCYKKASVNLCPNTSGQIMMGVMVNPPAKSEPSGQAYIAERQDILESLKRRSMILAEALNKLEGVSCNLPEGAMYAFPSITLSNKAQAAAKAAGKAPDAMYCLEMLDQTGLVTVPGSGFGQVPGTWHFRTTFLPSEEAIAGVIDNLAAFHAKFMDKYRDD